MQIRIDGKLFECEVGETILAVARRNGIAIPTLCHHEGLSGQGCCRVCIVEQNGRITPACVTQIEAECEIVTNSEKVKAQRGIILALLKKRAPDSQVVSDLAENYNAPGLQRLKAASSGKCILCGLCVRACRSLGTGAISTIFRGTEKRVGTPFDDSSPDCIGCASCAFVCPTGAIEFEDIEGKRHIWHREFDLLYCRECGTVLGTKEAIAFADDKGSCDHTLCDACRKKVIAEKVKDCFC